MRALLAVLGTVAGVALLFSFKTPDAAPPQARAGTSIATSSATSASTADAGPTPPGASPAGPAAPGGSSTSTAGAYRDGTYTGQDVPNQFGDVQVQVIVSGGRITDVKPLQLPFDRARSEEISQIAGPMLHDQALQVQSAQIDGVSGATYTSESYAESLQSALDQAH